MDDAAGCVNDGFDSKLLKFPNKQLQYSAINSLVHPGFYFTDERETQPFLTIPMFFQYVHGSHVIALLKRRINITMNHSWRRFCHVRCGLIVQTLFEF